MLLTKSQGMIENLSNDQSDFERKEYFCLHLIGYHDTLFKGFYTIYYREFSKKKSGLYFEECSKG